MSCVLGMSHEGISATVVAIFKRVRTLTSWCISGENNNAMCPNVTSVLSRSYKPLRNSFTITYGVGTWD